MLFVTIQSRHLCSGAKRGIDRAPRHTGIWWNWTLIMWFLGTLHIASFHQRMLLRFF